MKRRFLIITVLIVILLSLGLCACNNKYVSSYSTLSMVNQESYNAAKLSFDEFKGTFVYKFKWDLDGDGEIAYKASLDEGKVTVYYDNDIEKIELFTINGGESKDSKGGTLVKGTVYIIIEATERTGHGNFEFELV